MCRWCTHSGTSLQAVAPTSKPKAHASTQDPWDPSLDYAKMEINAQEAQPVFTEEASPSLLGGERCRFHLLGHTLVRLQK